MLVRENALSAFSLTNIQEDESFEYPRSVTAQ
jgi:hypothetical protein